jgi:hypothetical protein
LSLKKYFLFIFFCAFFCNIFPQKADGQESDANFSLRFPDDSAADKPEPVFVISSFEFNIDGITSPRALIDKGELVIGEKITGVSNLEKYIRKKTQMLINERVLDNVKIDYVTGREDEGLIPVHLAINIKDTWNIVAIPRPKYSSNSGFELVLKARDYNFLGTMSPLRLDIGYQYDEQGRNFFLFEQDANIPFRIFGLKWNFKFFNSFNYRPNMEKPFYFNNISGLSAELPFKFTTITVGFNESLFLNEENDDICKPLYGDFQDGVYMSSRPYVTWKIPTGVLIGNYGEIEYTPEMSAVFNHEFSQWPLDEIRKGPFLNLNHSLSFDNLDWIGNFLTGVDVSLGNSFSFDYYRTGKQAWTGYLGFKSISHFIITDFFGMSARLMYRRWFLRDGEYMETGDALRGILDKDVSADYMLSLNLDFPVRVLRFEPSKWLNNQKLRIFNFELHLSPVVDAALYHDPVNNIDFKFKNVLFAGGVEAVIFPEFFRSLFLRFSMGWNLSNFANGRNWEFYLGTDYHY